MIEGLTEENKQILEELKEEGAFGSPELMEREHTTTNTDPDDATVNRPIWRSKIFEAAMTRLVADQFFETVTMEQRVQPNPTFDYRLDDGVTTVEVGENSQIPGATIEFGKQDLHAVKHALTAAFTQEDIEDAFAAGIDAKAKAIDSIAKLISKEIDSSLNALMDEGSATVIYWSKDIPTDSTMREHYNTLNDALVDADTAIEGYDYKADGIMSHPQEKGLLRKSEDYKYARQGDYPEFKAVDGEAAGIPVFVSTNRKRGHIIMGEKKTLGTYGIYKPFHTMPAKYDPEYDKWLFNGRERSAMRITVGEAIALVLVTQKFTDETLVDSGDGLTFEFANYRIDPGATLTLTEDDGSGSDVEVDDTYTVDYWNGEVTFDTAPTAPVKASEYHAVKK
jgi:hypothetical protein